MIFVSITIPSYSLAGGKHYDLCDRKVASLPAKEQEKLEAVGFIYSSSLPQSVPPVVISARIIESCSKRIVAEKYYINKINGIEDFPISEKDFRFAKKEIARSVFYALNAKGVWVDGVSHEITNIVDSELLPELWDSLYMEIKANSVDLRFFTSEMFVQPSDSLLVLLQRIKPEDFLSHEVAIAFFLKKNGGLSIKLTDAEQELLRARKVVGGDISNDEIIKRAIEILGSGNLIPLAKAEEFVEDIFGY